MPVTPGVRHTQAIVADSLLPNIGTENRKRIAVGIWNLRRFDLSSPNDRGWLKSQMVIRTCLARGWRAVLTSDCACHEPESQEFNALGGRWLLIHAVCCAILLDPGLARVWHRGGSVRFDSR